MNIQSCFPTSQVAPVPLPHSEVYTAWLETLKDLPPPDIKLIAHLFGDSFISDTPLEKLSLVKACEFLIATLKATNARGEPFVPFAQKEQALALLEETLGWEKEIDAIRRGGGSLESVTEKIGTRGSVTLPGGWIDPDGGHTMLYRASKTKSDEPLYSFSIMTAGPGSEYHRKKRVHDKVKTQFCLTISEIQQECLSQDFFCELLKFRTVLPPKSDQAYTAKMIYDFVRERLGSKGAKAAESDTAFVTRPQSRVCSWKVLIDLLRSLVTLREYHTFKFYLLLSYLGAWYLVCTKDIYNESKVNLLKSAAVHFQKFLREAQGLSWADPKYLECAACLLNAIHNEKDQYTFGYLRLEKKVSAPKEVVLDDPKELFSKLKSLQEVTVQNIFEYTDLSSMIKTFSTYIRQAHFLYKLDQYGMLKKFVGEIFATFPQTPLNESVWARIAPDQILPCAKLLHLFSLLYASVTPLDRDGLAHRSHLFRSLEFLAQRAIFEETGSDLLPSSWEGESAETSPHEFDSPLGLFSRYADKTVISFPRTPHKALSFVEGYLEKKGQLQNVKQADPHFYKNAILANANLPEIIAVLRLEFFAMLCGVDLLTEQVKIDSRVNLGRPEDPRFQICSFKNGQVKRLLLPQEVIARGPISLHLAALPDEQAIVQALDSQFVYVIKKERLLEKLSRFAIEFHGTADEYLYIDPPERLKNRALGLLDFVDTDLPQTLRSKRFERFRAKDSKEPHLVLLEPEKWCYLVVYREEKYRAFNLATGFELLRPDKEKELEKYVGAIQELDDLNFVHLERDDTGPKMLCFPRLRLSFDIIQNGTTGDLQFRCREYPGYYWVPYGKKPIPQVGGAVLLASQKKNILFFVPNTTWYKLESVQDPYSRKIGFRRPYSCDEIIPLVECMHTQNLPVAVFVARLFFLTSNFKGAFNLLSHCYQNTRYEDQHLPLLESIISIERPSSPNHIALRLYASWLYFETCKHEEIEPALVELVARLYKKYKRTLKNISKDFVLLQHQESMILSKLPFSDHDSTEEIE